MRSRVKAAVVRLRMSRWDKGDHELDYWRQRARIEGQLGNAHYEALYTEMFGLDRDFYAGQRILDIGCGPRGSLEWANGARQRVGLDPLAERYRELGTDRHVMEYVSAPAEKIPFGAGHFDIVTSLNNLDHCDDLAAVIREVARVTSPGGSFLLEVEVGHEPTPAEPIALWFDVLADFRGSFEVMSEQRFEMPVDHAVHDAWSLGVRYDESHDRDESGARRPGVLVARMRRRT